MDSRLLSTESPHHYQTGVRPQIFSVLGHPRSSSASPSICRTLHHTQPGFLPTLLLHQHTLNHGQLLEYSQLLRPNRESLLVSTGFSQIPVSTAKIPPAAHVKPYKVSNKDSSSTTPSGTQSHGNRAAKSLDNAKRAPITHGKEAFTMPGKKHLEASYAISNSTRLPSSNPNPFLHTMVTSEKSQQSSSVPSTPHQHARKFSFESREPSPTAAQNHSPRSAYSETNGNVPSIRPLPPKTGCPYESAIPHARRRMPYKLGTDKLEKVAEEKTHNKLPEKDERKLTEAMCQIYRRLLPTREVEKKRQSLVQKLEKLFNAEWPGHEIRVHLFGSSGNLLCSDDSDVDICITTEWRELEGVCLIAELLAKHGMEKVVCVSSAKVPIVKIWDPELGLACDMNVNNTPALENTRLVRTYVEIDDRVRPLAMIIKYWTRRRKVNDAAFGGTLSSYTWICLIIAFLQLREPPVVPALHQEPYRISRKDGRQSQFADDVVKLRAIGSKNKASLGQLLFEFFRFYAHEFDYEKWVLSIRLGKMIPKEEKKWHIATNNSLCVEEPFNTIRNLSNTADDFSFRGLHLELRRAFDLIAQGKLDECCEEYVFPKEEERIWVKRPSQPRPVLVRSSSQQHGGRGGRNGFRGRGGYFPRNGNNNRRASASTTCDPNTQYLPGTMAATMTPKDMLWYQVQAQAQAAHAAQAQAQAAQAQAQNASMAVPQDVYTYLAAQQQHETNLRFQMYTQAQHANQQQALAHAQRMQGSGTPVTDRSRTNSFDNTPLTAPLRPELVYGYGFPIQGAPFYAQPTFTTYSSSPASTTAAPAGNGADFRRSLHRQSANGEPGVISGSGAHRSQSQPASRTPNGSFIPASPYAGSGHFQGMPVFASRPMATVPISFTPNEPPEHDLDNAPVKTASNSPPDEDGHRYLGYYVHDAASPDRRANANVSTTPAFGDLGLHGQSSTRRRLSTDVPQTILDRRMRRTSRSPSPSSSRHARAFSVGTEAPSLALSAPQSGGKTTAPQNRAPVVVNGSAAPKLACSPNHSGSAVSGRRAAAAGENVASNEIGYDNTLHIQQQYAAVPGALWTDGTIVPPPTASEPSPPHSDQPLVVNGSTTMRLPTQTAPHSPDRASFQARVALLAAMNSGVACPHSLTAADPNTLPGFTVPMDRPRIISRQQQNGIAPLDLATGEFAVAQDLQHLSPVYENRPPSPIVTRTYEEPSVAASSRKAAPKEQKQVSATPQMKATASLNTAPSMLRTSPKHSPTSAVPSSAASKHDLARSPAADARMNDGLKENGHARVKSQAADIPSGWQKSKNRKKAAADLKSAGNAMTGFSLSEDQPRSNVDRKGG